MSATSSHHLPYIALPDEINLSNPAMEAAWYKNVQFTITLAGGKQATLSTQPLVFYAAVLKDSKQAALAEKFVQFLQSPEGQKLFAETATARRKVAPFHSGAVALCNAWQIDEVRWWMSAQVDIHTADGLPRARAPALIGALTLLLIAGPFIALAFATRWRDFHFAPGDTGSL